MILQASHRILSMMFTAVFLLCINNNGTAAPSDEFITDSGTLIAFQKFDRSYHALLQYLKYTDRTVCYYLRNSGRMQKIKCKIYVINKKILDSINILTVGNGLNIYISSGILARGRDFQAMTGLINALLYAKSGIFPEKAARPLPG